MIRIVNRLFQEPHFLQKYTSHVSPFSRFIQQQYIHLLSVHGVHKRGQNKSIEKLASATFDKIDIGRLLHSNICLRAKYCSFFQNCWVVCTMLLVVSAAPPQVHFLSSTNLRQHHWSSWTEPFHICFWFYGLRMVTCFFVFTLNLSSLIMLKHQRCRLINLLNC